MLLTDTLDANTAYVPGSTTCGGAAVADNASPGAPLPLAAPGLALGTLAPNGQISVTFVARVAVTIPEGVTNLINRAGVTTAAGVRASDWTATAVSASLLELSLRSSAAGSLVAPSQVITYTLVPRARGATLLSDVRITDAIPANTAYVAGSADPSPTAGPDPLDWRLGSNTAGAAGVNASATVSLVSRGALVASGDAVTVTMQILTAAADTNVKPASLVITGVNAAGATCGAASPASLTVAAGVPVTFTWSCVATAGAAPGSVTFSAGATGQGLTYPTARSNSVLVSRPLSFRVRAASSFPAGAIRLTDAATASAANAASVTAVVSDALQATARGRIFQDTDADGVLDAGEPGLPGVRVVISDSLGTWRTATSDAGGIYTATVAAGVVTADVDETSVPAGYVRSAGADPTAVTANAGGVGDLGAAGFRPPQPVLMVTKRVASPASGATPVSETVTFTIRIDSVGEAPITSLILTDTYNVRYLTPNAWNVAPDNRVAGSLVWSASLAPFLPLPPGRALTLTVGFRTEAPTAGVTINQAQATTAGSSGSTIASAAQASLAITENPAVAVDAGGQAGAWVGGTATFTHTVSNTGDTWLSGVVVSDTLCGPATYRGGDSDHDGQLDRSENWMYTCLYTVRPGDPDPLVANATVTASDPLGLHVSSQDRWITDLLFFRFGDRLWLDDGNGVQDPNELQGLSGVPVRLTGQDYRGAPVNLTVYSVFGGRYLVENLLPGNYSASAPAIVDGYSLRTPSPRVFTLSEVTPQRLDIDFGYVAPTGLSLARFTAAAQPGLVTLTWVVQAAAPAASFRIWRSDSPKATAALRISKQPVLGDASGVFGFVDATVEAGRTYWYWLEEVATGQRFGPQEVAGLQQPVFSSQIFLPMVRE